MKNITIGFSKSATFSIYSWAIMLTEHTPFSHVYLKYRDDFIGRYMYFQASSSLVNFMGSKVFLTNETIIDEFEFNINEITFGKIMQFVADNAGKPYGVLSIFGLAIVQLASYLGIRMNNPFKEAGKTWICSQLIAELLKNCDNVQLDMPLNDIRPKDMYNIVKNLPQNLNKE